MSTVSRFFALSLLFGSLVYKTSARAIWIPEDFDPLQGSNVLSKRDDSICGGVDGLNPCGDDFPSSFCCPSSTTCVALNTTSSTSAAICCPDGADCAEINTVRCDEKFQDASEFPGSQLHSDPPRELETCGDGCCPMGYECKDGGCAAKAATAGIGESSESSSTSSPQPTTSVSENNGRPLVEDPTATDSGSGFSGKSFAAGLIPGLGIGAFVAACLILVCRKKRRVKRDDNFNEKQNFSRDTLTDLGPMANRSKTHGRSISEPTYNPTNNRTDFLRSTPPHNPAAPGTHGYHAEAVGPLTPTAHRTRTSTAPQIKPLSSTRSPFQAPITPLSTEPKRRPTRTLTISPIRALKKQKSTHSLRRHATTNHSPRTKTNPATSLRRPSSPRSRNGSKETIRVLLPRDESWTPDLGQQRLGPARYQPQPLTFRQREWEQQEQEKELDGDGDSAKTSFDSLEPRPLQARYTPSQAVPAVPAIVDTPTRPPIARAGPGAATGNGASAGVGRALGSPYTPSKHVGNDKGRAMLGVGPGHSNEMPMEDKRVTTFSVMMEKAGIQRGSGMFNGGGRKA